MTELMFGPLWQNPVNNINTFLQNLMGKLDILKLISHQNWKHTNQTLKFLSIIPSLTEQTLQ